MIARTAFQMILKEYDEKQLRAARNLREKKERMEAELPRLAEIESEIASLSVSEALRRIAKTPSPDSYKEQLAALKQERRTVLAQGGYTERDLAPVYECEKCQDTGYADGKLCTCFREKITDVLYDQAGIRGILEKENFGSYSFRYYPEGQSLDSAKFAVETAQKFVAEFDRSEENLYITGTTGVGKTFLTNCIAKELLDRGRFVVYLSAIRLFEIFSDAAFGSYGGSAEQNDGAFMRKHIYDCDLLIIDDLGTELVNSFTNAQLFNCINERILGRKHTIISTNLSLKQLQENYSERVFSRIANKYTMIRLFGNDIRMRKKLEDNE